MLAFPSLFKKDDYDNIVLYICIYIKKPYFINGAINNVNPIILFNYIIYN